MTNKCVQAKGDQTESVVQYKAESVAHFDRNAYSLISGWDKRHLV
jgi:hypothetical protein